MNRNGSTVAVVGAGIAGLGAALALARIGYRVTVFEADNGLNETGGGLQLSPNCTRILDDYGLMGELSPSAMHLDAIKFRRYSTGQIIGQTDLDPHMTNMYGFPYLLVRRADLQRALYHGATKAGAQVHFARAVFAVQDDEQAQPRLTLGDGEEFSADIIIGADGARSRCRKSMFPDSVLDPIPTDSCAYRAVVAAESVHRNPRTRHLLEVSNSQATFSLLPNLPWWVSSLTLPPVHYVQSVDSNAWLGPHRQLLGYPIRDGKDFNIVGIHLGHVEDPNKSTEMVEDIEAMRSEFGDFDPVVRELLNMVDSAQRWQLQNLPVLDKWTSPSGRCLLIGDAAHAMVPFLAQGASSAIEDGSSLAVYLASCASASDVPAAIRACEQHRQGRIEGLRRGALYNEKILHLPDGEEQITRDQTMQPKAGRPCSNLWSDEAFSQWLFGYCTSLSSNDSVLSGSGLPFS